MGRIFHADIEMDPLSLILGFPSEHLKTAANKRLYSILTFAARKNILLQWVSDRTPTVGGWRKIIFELIPLEYLTYVVHHSVEQFYRMWHPFLDYIGPDLSAILFKGLLRT